MINIEQSNDNHSFSIYIKASCKVILFIVQTITQMMISLHSHHDQCVCKPKHSRNWIQLILFPLTELLHKMSLNNQLPILIVQFLSRKPLQVFGIFAVIFLVIAGVMIMVGLISDSSIFLLVFGVGDGLTFTIIISLIVGSLFHQSRYQSRLKPAIAQQSMKYSTRILIPVIGVWLMELCPWQ